MGYLEIPIFLSTLMLFSFFNCEKNDIVTVISYRVQSHFKKLLKLNKSEVFQPKSSIQHKTIVSSAVNCLNCKLNFQFPKKSLLISKIFDLRKGVKKRCENLCKPQTAFFPLIKLRVLKHNSISRKILIFCQPQANQSTI